MTESEPHAASYGWLTTRYVRGFTRHYRKLYVLALAIILGFTFVSVGQYNFMIEQSEQSEYDWTVASSAQSLNRDSLEWARSNRGLSAADSSKKSTDNLADVKPTRSQTKHFLTLIYQHEQLNRTDNFITVGNLKTICDAENTLLGHPDYPKICFKGKSAIGHTLGGGQWCARQLYSVTSLYYLAWKDDAPIFDKDSPSYLFSESTDAELAFMQIFAGLPVLYSKPTDAPTEVGDLYNGHKRVCDKLSAKYVEERTQQLIKMLDHSDDARQTLGFFFSDQVEKQGHSELTRSNLVVSGGPLPGYDSKDDREDEQEEQYDEVYAKMEQALWDYFGLVNSNTKSAYASRKPVVNGIAGSAAVLNGIDVRFVGPWADFEFDRMVNADLMWVCGSVTFVYFYILFHTRSVFLASMSMFQIFLSLPLAFFVYRVIGQIDYFVQLHILTIFLVLGVGADDCFVFVDSYKQTKVTKGLDTQLQRMLWAWTHTAQSTLNTSVTTAIAFVSTSITPVMPISSFGIYAAIAIVMNYVLTITFFPLVILMYENDVAVCWASCRRQPRPETVPMGLDAVDSGAVQPTPGAQESAAKAAAAGKGKAATDEVPPALKAEDSLPEHMGVLPFAPYASPDEQLRPAQVFFRRYYSPMLNYAPTKYKWFKPISIALVCFWAGLGGAGANFAFKLRPPVKEEQWFTADHMYTGFGDISSNRFLSGADDAYVDMSLVFGVQSFERSAEFVRWNPSKKRGSTVFDTSFDLSEREGQEALVAVCKGMREAECTVAACVGGFRRFTRPDELYCPIEQFDDWYEEKYYNATGTKTSAYKGSRDRPTGDSFVKLVKDFSTTSYESAGSFGFIEGELLFVEVPFASTLLKEQPFAVTISFYDAVHAALADVVREADPERALGAKSFVYAGNSFTWIMTEQALVANVLQGFAICFPVCFIVLVFATGSPLISLFAIVTIALIVGLTLGFCQAIMGWGLGVAETVCSTIVIGFSVDYVVHLGHSYRESSHFSREGKVSDALTHMGITVIAGAVTTFGSGIFMFACQMTFFTKMATLIVAVVVLAILYALMFFMPLCAIAGPEGEMKSFTAYAHDFHQHMRGKTLQSGRPPARPDQPAAASHSVPPSDASSVSLP